MNKKSTNLADKLFPIQDNKEETVILDLPPEQRRLITETYDFSVATIMDYLKKGDMFIPKFQRSYVWNRSQASRLIESLIIQCPVPVIYLNQESDEKLSVIDGNQRITSIKLFLNDEFVLSGLTAYPELEGFKFSELDPRFQRHILNRTLRCITILKETHPQIKIDVFERLNTGAQQLNNQEVRHGIFYGDIIKLVDKLSLNKTWKKVTNFKDDPRMKGSELILRFFALRDRISSYKPPLKSFLNLYAKDKIKMSENELLEIEADFLDILNKSIVLFKEKPFRIINEKLKPSTTSINSALFDSIMVSIKELNLDMETIEKINKDLFLNDFFKLLSEEKYRQSIETGTSSKSSLNTRINGMKKIISKHIL